MRSRLGCNPSIFDSGMLGLRCAASPAYVDRTDFTLILHAKWRLYCWPRWAAL